MKLYTIWFLLLFCISVFLKRDQGLRYGHYEMCLKLKRDFVEKITKDEIEDCNKIFDQVITFKQWETKTNSWLGSWGWSHLAVYTPQESSEIWQSKSKNIGVKIKTVEGKILVYRAHSKSVFQKGDVFLEVNGEKPNYESDVLNAEGEFKILRKEQVLTIKATSGEFYWDDQVQFEKNTVRIPSFRGEFFKDISLEKIKEAVNSIPDDLIYIDLRDNPGGNIASALRFMSVFLCDSTMIGSFRIPSREEFGESDYPLSVDQSVQVEHMKKYGLVHLRTPQNKKCSSKKVKVLVNRNTASTAELVAQAFQDLRRGDVVGEQTAGRMVLSSWDQIVYFPEGFYFSHPYALYNSLENFEIEGEGVQPNIKKTYLLEYEAKGLDSFKI